MQKIPWDPKESELFVRRMRSNHAREVATDDTPQSPPPLNTSPIPSRSRVPRPSHLSLIKNLPSPPKNPPPPKPPRAIHGLQNMPDKKAKKNSLSGLPTPDRKEKVRQKFLQDLDPMVDMNEEPPDFIPPPPASHG